MTTAFDWRPLLHGIDVVVNAVVILRQRDVATLDALSLRGRASRRRAAGHAAGRADLRARCGRGRHDRRHRSKRAADEQLLALPVDGSRSRYLLAGACWLLVVWIQLRMRDLAVAAAASESRCRRAIKRCCGAGSPLAMAKGRP